MTRRGKILLGVGAVLLLLVLYLLAWPRAIGIDRDGKVVHDLFDPKGERISVVTSVQERAGHLYLGSFADHAWARIPLP